MVGVINKKRITCNLKQACCNYPNETQGLYCNDCEKCGIVNSKDKKCISCNLSSANRKYKNH